jgi:2-polyprenyl-3-methyl-5-hydroxy-6-metoxy-1,4-benzoquinol methylase
MRCIHCEDNEVYKTLGWRRAFHELLVKPISYYFSSRILRNELLKAIGDVSGKRVIDTSCGDDIIAVKLMERGAKVTCNDLCKDSMKPLFKYKGLKFLNKNVLDLTCKRRYDVVLFKNTFHHLKTTDQIKQCLEVISRLGKRVVIMDIDNPRKYWLARLWNNYYRYFLRDQGNFFIDYKKFKKYILMVFPKARVERIHTVKGYYMLAVT